MSKIQGETLLGFGDFFEGGIVVGASTKPLPRKPPARKPAKGGGKPTQTRSYPKGRNNPAMRDQGKVLTKSKSIVTKAAAAMSKAKQLLARKPAAKPVVLGAAAAATLTPKQKLAVQKQNAAADKATKTGRELAQRVLKTRKTAGDLAKKMVTQKKLAQKLRKPQRGGGRGARRPIPGKGKTTVGALMNDAVIGEDVREMLEEYYETVGASPDPNYPGYLTDGTPDPAYTDPSMMDPSLTDPLLTDSPFDTGQELPPAPPMDVFTADMTTVGGIAYDGSKGTPEGYVLSYGLATRKTDHSVEPDTAQIDGTEHFGYVFGLYDKVNPNNGGIPWGSGDNLKPGVWNHIEGRFWLGRSFSKPVDASEAFASYNKKTKYGEAYGPLVGNPMMPDFARMRVDGQGNMFWFPQEAPDWLTFPIKQAAALTAQAAAKAQADADAAYAAAEAKARADEAAAMAAQDAANALAESQAASQQAIAMAEADTQAQQLLVEQAAADTAQQQLDILQQQQAGDIMARRAQRMEDYYAKHPEEEFAIDPNEPPMPGMEDGGGGEGEYDDGAPIPGGDIMLDADGEGFEDGGEDGDGGDEF